MQQYDPKPVEVVNNLTTNDSNKALSAAQGYALNSSLADKVNTSAIANNLTTSSSGYVLDARQGKELSEKTLQRQISYMSTGTKNLYGLDTNSTYLVFSTSNVTKGVWVIQTGISSGAVTNIVPATNLSIQMASSSSLILQYSNSSGYDSLGLCVVKLGRT